MKTKHGIPQKVLDEVVKRDIKCVYCHKEMVDPWDSKNSGDSVTIEHLNHRKDWDSVRSTIQKGGDVSEIIAICCGSCNYSRGDRSLREWFDIPYCKDREPPINEQTVAEPVRRYLRKYEPV